MTLETLLAVTPYPFVSVVLWAVLSVAVLYLARSSAHKVIVTVCQALHDVLRLAAQSFEAAEQRLSERNREVLLAAGREAKERIVEREFDRVTDSVHRDLAGYPALQRGLNEAIVRLEEDHAGSVEVPPEPPAWIRAVEAIAQIDAPRDGAVSEILEDVHASLVKAQAKALGEYRGASRRRHELLRRMMPQWRNIEQALARVNRNIENLLERSRSIDRHLEEYAEIVQGTERATQVLSSSSLVQFFVSALVLAVAVGGAAINFSLIARPMAEMVGGTMFIGGFRTSEIAALVIIMVEVSMGIFLMESLRITRLFPVIGALPDKTRVRMVAVTFAILLLLASVEAGLAYMRELLMQDELATTELLRGGGAALQQSDYLWITTAAQMGMGFTLPFALVFVAIPLETFVHSLRTVVGLCGIGVLRAAHLVLRLLGTLFLHAAAALVRAYDIPIFMPLWIEAKYRKREPGRVGSEEDGEERYAEIAR
jgi:ABC-type multidrug transport system fused ATPase/permease subunit